MVCRPDLLRFSADIPAASLWRENVGVLLASSLLIWAVVLEQGMRGATRQSGRQGRICVEREV